jgi:hypothetical protein
MSQTPRSEQPFDLARFVLGYLEHEGSVVAPPAYGIHEALLPDELAAQLRLDPYLRLAFDAEASDEVLQLTVNHPVVERIAELLERAAGNALVHINHVRPEKKGLLEAATKTLSFPNARFSAQRDVVEHTALHHYLRCNFKAIFLSDEKQEQIVSAVVDVQGGYAVRDAELLQRLVTYETESDFHHLPAARPRWAGAGEALAPVTLHALLLRAQAVAEAALAERLTALQTRAQRFLELDIARLEDYYASLERDLRQRLARAESTELERRSGIEAKLAALHAEHDAKLADTRERYQLRVELELINVLITAQPKILLPVEISNRRVTVARVVVWDPLLHRLEPLVCEVCGEPGEGLHLCTSGHLAHRACLAPQCIDCNRVYCRLCADQMLVCAVCGRPICRASSRTCSDCGRVTCAEHQKLCHAADGQPALLPKPEAAPVKPTPPPPPPPSTSSAKPKAKAPTKAAKPAAQPAIARPAPSAIKLDVQIYENEPLVVAFVMRSTKRVLATRSFALTPEGIGVRCECEKIACPANDWLHRPANLPAIQTQMAAFLTELRQEYHLPPKRTVYLYEQGGQFTERPSFILPAIWRSPTMLAEAQKGFDRRG